ncbi:related to RNA binding protein Nrd1 [Fusarium torulosum]|uniref:Related to RNA binding protein Nrd1 n=1 Tax=Fusarium torulosum TaxID=33205 RepID=A0AAE8M4M8_9HYPO|nr:related to RNA binding protein Nrd1 [Fusarium torulosum]
MMKVPHTCLVCLRQSLTDRGVDDATLNSLCVPPAQSSPAYTHDQPGPSTPTSFVLNANASPYQKRSSATLELRNETQGLHKNENRHSNISARPSTKPGALGVSMNHQPLVVRGGPLLEIFLRPKENSATVSFVQEADAVAFLEHSRTHGLYIKDRKIHTRWSDHQYVVKGQVVYHVTRGASRNFVIRKRDPNLTTRSIRDDLEHIHNLHVIDIQMDKDNCLVSTSAIHAAIFARNCLQSRLEYKNSRIEWVADECAQPLGSLSSETPAPTLAPASTPTPEAKSESRSASTIRSRKNLMGNRFRALELSDTDGSNGDDSSDDTL